MKHELQNRFIMSERETMFVSFSGGRTSAYMCWWLLNNKADEYDFIFTFANTGAEHEKTLEFVNECDIRFGLNLVWVEAVVNPVVGEGIRFKQVNFKTASRNNEPFEEVIKKHGIPNQDYPHCNRDLKILPMKTYKQSLGFKRNHQMAIGIRSDEADRMQIKEFMLGELIYPLIQWQPITKPEIRHWWSMQDFDLDVPEHLGNCVTCWKKSDRKLWTIAKNEPDRFDFFKRMEEEHGDTGSGDQKRVFFRKHRTVSDIISESKKPFKEFDDDMPELQLRLLDPIDYSNGCSDSCEAQ